MKAYDVLVMLLSPTGTARVPCPVSKLIRIVSVFCPGSGAEGPQAFLTMSRGQQGLWEGATEPMTASITHVTWGLGNTSVSPRQDIVDPVTGVITYNQQVTGMSAGLPDVWWPFEIDVASSLVPGSLNAPLIYQLRDRD